MRTKGNPNREFSELLEDLDSSISGDTEKPPLDYAREHLVTHAVQDDHYLTIFGQYILTPRVFELLEENIERNRREGGEFQLTSCLDRLRQEEGFVGLRIKGRRYDIGDPVEYRKTLLEYQSS